MLTVVPSGVTAHATDSGRRAIKWLPLVGATVGATVGAAFALVYAGLRWMGVGEIPASLLAAIVGVAADFAVTRGMHWDGLADVADAWWGGFDKVRRLEIMSDSAVGSFGVFAVLVVFAAFLVGLTMSASTLTILVPAFAISRLAGVFAAQLGKPAKVGGLGSSVLAYGTSYAVGRRAAVTWLAAAATSASAVAVVWFLPGSPAVLALSAATAASTFCAAALPHVIAGRMGGVTGDVIGASILLTQVVSVVAFSIAFMAG